VRTLFFVIFAWQISAVGDIAYVHLQGDEVCHCSLLAHEDACTHSSQSGVNYFTAIHHCGAHSIDMQHTVFESFIFILPELPTLIPKFHLTEVIDREDSFIYFISTQSDPPS